VVRWLQPGLTRFFVSRSAEDPEGLTQETFIRMSRAIEQFVNGGANELRAWAYAIARTVAIDASRRAAARPQTTSGSSASGSDDGTTPIERIADTSAGVEEDLASRSRVDDLLKSLTDQQAEFLRLRIYGDQTTEMAATILGMNLGQAKQLQRRALRKLAQILSEKPPDDD
jgi:RNA polymerase sigma factor (sigma-70 family)